MPLPEGVFLYMDMKKKKILNRPGIHSASSDNDVAAIGLVSTILASNGGVAVDLNHHDTWPNIDGYLELKTVSGEPDGMLSAQVKPITVGKKIISHTFDDDKFICYCKEERGLPIIFIGVDLQNKKAYWLEMTPNYANSLKSLTIRIPSENVIDYNNTNYLTPWKNTCDRRKKILINSGLGFDNLATDEVNSQQSAITQLYQISSQSNLLKKNIDAVNSIVENVKEKILLYEGHLFLVSPTYINNNEIRQTIRKNLDITTQQEEFFISELIEKGILSKTGDVMVFTEDALGQEKLIYLTEKKLIDVDKIYDSFPEAKVRKTILKKLAVITNVEQVDTFFKNLIKNFLEGFNKLTNNDDIITNLELLDEYSFRVPKQTVKLINQIIETKPLLVKKYRSKYGVFPGAHYEKVLIKVLDVLNTIRYLEIKPVFEIAISLSTHIDAEVKKKALELIKHISEYNLFALKKISYYPQKQVLSFIQKWNTNKMKANFSALLEIGKEVLSPEFEGSQMTDYNTLTLSFGPLKASEELKSIRNSLVKKMESLYLETDDIQVCKKLLDTFEIGTRTPNRGNYSDELEKLILNYTNDLMLFYISILPIQNFILIHEIEEQLHWFVKRFGKKKVKNIRQLQKILEANKQYQIFRIFYGYDLGFDEKLPWREAQTKREGIIDKFIADISKDNYPEWERSILAVGNCCSDDNYDKFQYFNTFLYRFAVQKSSIAIKLLEKAESLHPFLLQLTLGLWKSPLHDDIRKTLLKWAKGTNKLTTIAELFWYTKEIDLELITIVFNSAVRSKDISCLTALVRSLVVLYQGEPEIKNIFLATIKELTKLENVRWVFNFYPQESKLIKSLTNKETDVLLKNLLLVEDVSYDLEEILVSIAENFPDKVIQYFAKRISIQMKKNKRSRYDAIPYSLHELPQILNKKSEIVLDEVFSWFNKKEWLFRFDSSYLLKAIFPNMEEPLKKRLLLLIKKGGSENAKTVLNVMRVYKGQSFLHPVAKAFIKKYLVRENSKLYKDYLGELFIALSATGVVSGEYGLPNAYKQKKDEIKKWKDDKSKSIQIFVKKYESYLDKNISYHSKRADEDIELMKRGAM